MRLFASPRSKKKAAALLLNAGIALALGLACYLLFRPDAAIARVIYLLLGIENPPKWAFSINSSLIRNYAADFLWAYALTCALNIIAIENRGKMGALFALSIFLGCTVELLQGAGITIGTYDPLDIAIQICAAIIAEAITLITLGKRY